MSDAAAERDDEAEPTVVAGNGASRALGRYRLCFELASGGMATVFLARAEGPGGFEKLVAIKRIHPHLSKERAFIDMFLDEARIASQIDHPNVCSVFEFGEASGTYYIAMEYLHGESLARVRKALKPRPDGRGRRHLAMCARIVADACEGLHAAHELVDARGEPLHVVHRDVSPGNLYVTYDGGVRVVDFGIATARNRLHQTATGTVKGKFAYMSPEQLRGGLVDRRTDVWALGVVLWELLTQKRLFRRNSESETMFAVMQDPILPPGVVNPEVPPRLETIVMRALDRNPKDRYPTARALGRDLMQYVATTGQAIGLADVAEWMEMLFPESKAKKGQLLDIARQSEPIPHVAGETSNTSQLTSGTRVRRVTKRRAPGWLAASLVALGIGVGVAVGLGVGGGASNEDVPAPSAPAVAAATGATGTTAETERPEGGGAPDDSPAGARAETARADSEAAAAPETEAAAAPETEAAAAPETEAAGGAEEAEPADPAEEAEATGSADRRPVARRADRSRARRTARAQPEPTTASAPPPPPAEPAVTGPGQLIVVTPGGWADVYQGGRLLGQTPLRVELRSGRHLLTIRPFGRTPGEQRRIQIRAGETERVSVPVSP